MAVQVATSSKVWAGIYDISGYLTGWSMPKSADKVETTANGATSRTYLPGLQSGGFSFQGFAEFGTSPIKIEKIMRTLKGVIDTPVTVVPQGGTVGNAANFMAASFGGYGFGGEHGAAIDFNWNGGTSKWHVIGGRLDEPGAVARTATGQTTGQQLGAVGASQYLYAAVHVLAGGTGTADIIVQSDDNSGFTSAVTSITFPQISGVTGGSAIMRLAGALADTWYRFQYTLATSPSVTFAAVFGIAS